MLRMAKADTIKSETVKRCRKTKSTAKKVNSHQQERGEGPTYSGLCSVHFVLNLCVCICCCLQFSAMEDLIYLLS